MATLNLERTVRQKNRGKEAKRGRLGQPQKRKGGGVRYDQVCHVHDLETGALLHTFPHPHWVVSVAM